MSGGGGGVEGEWHKRVKHRLGKWDHYVNEDVFIAPTPDVFHGTSFRHKMKRQLKFFDS